MNNATQAKFISLANNVRKDTSLWFELYRRWVDLRDLIGIEWELNIRPSLINLDTYLLQ